MVGISETVIYHELGSTADYRLRDKFYEQVTTMNFEEKSKLSKLLSNKISGCKYSPVEGESIIIENLKRTDLETFKKDGYAYPYKIQKDFIPKILNEIKDCAFENTIQKKYEGKRNS